MSLENENSMPPQADARVEQFVRLLQANRNRIYTYIFILVPNSNDADDIMQETTTVLWRKFEEFEIGTDFVAWALRIAHFQVLSFRKKKATGKVVFTDELVEILENDAKSTGNSSKVDQIDTLKKCVKKLKGRERQMLVMKYEDNFSTKMISERIGLTVRGVNKSFARIHLMLQRCVRLTNSLEGLQ